MPLVLDDLEERELVGMLMATRMSEAIVDCGLSEQKSGNERRIV